MNYRIQYAGTENVNGYDEHHYYYDGYQYILKEDLLDPGETYLCSESGFELDESYYNSVIHRQILEHHEANA